MRLAQVSASDLIVRIDRLESEIRQLTGTVEALQYRNQQLEQQLRHLQEEAELRLQDPGASGTRPPQLRAQAPAAPVPAGPPPASRRSDAFDPTQNPNMPGAPRALGSMGPTGRGIEEPPGEPPGRRTVGAPLDLATPSGQPPEDAPPAPPSSPPAGGLLPPPPSRNPNATGAPQLAVLPPTATARDEYDLAYGYVLRKDYAPAEAGFRTFLKKYPGDRLVPDANYWLGEALFQRQLYRDAAESFLAVSTKYETAAKAPDALLRLGQSLAALGEKEAACATFGEIGRKYPRASVSVKQGVEREQKRVHC